MDSDFINNKVVRNELHGRHGREKRHINVKIIYKQRYHQNDQQKIEAERVVKRTCFRYPLRRDCVTFKVTNKMVSRTISITLLFSWFKVGPNSANGSLQCLCTHLSAFGGDFLVAPNPIDFDKVWDAFSNILESKNFLVLSTVCVMLGLYLVAAVFARRADRSDSQKVSIIRIKL